MPIQSRIYVQHMLTDGYLSGLTPLTTTFKNSATSDKRRLTLAIEMQIVYPEFHRRISIKSLSLALDLKMPGLSMRIGCDAWPDRSGSQHPLRGSRP
jgi:hypothetical protein